MIKLSMERKVASTVECIEGKIKAGWGFEQAFVNSKLLWNLSEKRMKEVRSILESKGIK